MLLKQPDLGMTAVITATWFAQFFVAGLSFIWVHPVRGLSAPAGLVGAYFMFFHVARARRPVPRKAPATPTRSTARWRRSRMAA